MNQGGIMAIGAGDVTMAQPARRRRRLRITVLGLLVLVALSALALFLYRKYLLPPNEQPTIVVAYSKVAPTVDGAIGEHEYDPGVTITWNADNTLAAFEHVIGDSTKNKPSGGQPSDELRLSAHAEIEHVALDREGSRVEVCAQARAEVVALFMVVMSRRPRDGHRYWTAVSVMNRCFFAPLLSEARSSAHAFQAPRAGTGRKHSASRGRLGTDDSLSGGGRKRR